MDIYLHKSLCDLNKAGELASSANPKSQAGEQRGGNYFHRIQVGYTKQNTPKYRYFHTKEEWEGYTNKKGETQKHRTKKTGEESAEKLKEKTTKEHEESSEKQAHSSLFLKDKDKKVQKSLYITIEARHE